jgi:bifunctional N-acetylglucosamine-1-phosphate-uridyltransferase/glucosamine-1-phosphate-acetyltransferase GlmU-like protein
LNQKLSVRAVVATDSSETMGVNSPEELEVAEKILMDG